MKSHYFAFTRKHGFSEIETLWLVKIDLINMESGLDDALQALTASVTNWIKETEEGREAWEESCEDFNVGDLFLQSRELLRPFLEKYGIAGVDLVYQLSEGEEVSFDRILVNYETL